MTTTLDLKRTVKPITEGRSVKGGRNALSTMTQRPPPPAPMRPVAAQSDFCILGIDPGASGAFAFLWPHQALLDVVDMPMYEVTRTKTRRFVSGPDVAAILEAYPNVAHCFIEEVHARPDDGAVSAFNFGQRYGMVLGALAMAKIPQTDARPSVWKPAMGAPKDKAQSVARAKQLMPGVASVFSGPRGGLKDGRAEAAMLALYGALQLGHKLTAPVRLFTETRGHA